MFVRWQFSDRVPRHGGKQHVDAQIYILKNNLTSRYYIGSTNDLIRRIVEHNRGQTKSTKRKGIWEIIYTEDHNTVLEARRRERLIKSYKVGMRLKG